MRSQKCIHILSWSIFEKVMGKKPQILKAHLVAPLGDPGSNPAEGEIFFLHFFLHFFALFWFILLKDPD